MPLVSVCGDHIRCVRCHEPARRRAEGASQPGGRRVGGNPPPWRWERHAERPRQPTGSHPVRASGVPAETSASVSSPLALATAAALSSCLCMLLVGLWSCMLRVHAAYFLRIPMCGGSVSFTHGLLAAQRGRSHRPAQHQ